MNSKKEARHDAIRVRVQNEVRGALASIRAPSTPKLERHRWKQEQGAYSQINRALSQAKSKLPHNVFVELEEWTERQLREQQTRVRKLGVPLPSLGLLPLDLRARSFQLELQRALSQLRSNSGALLDFCDTVLVVQQRFCASQWAELKDTLVTAGRSHGRSYWELELLIAAEQLLGGVERMKGLVAQLGAGGAGVQKFLLYYVGVRNEPAQAASRFAENLAPKLADADLKPGLENYLRYRLLGQLGADEAKLAYVLSAEQLTTPIDLLFTTLRVVAWVQRNTAAFSDQTRRVAELAAKELAPFARKLGVRLQSLEIALDEHPQLPLDHEASLIYFENPTDPFALAHTAIERLWTKPADSETEKQNQLEHIVAGVVSRLSTRTVGLHRRICRSYSLTSPHCR
jgi:hypothetical protein